MTVGGACLEGGLVVVVCAEVFDTSLSRERDSHSDLQLKFRVSLDPMRSLGLDAETYERRGSKQNDELVREL
jgi:hypothetical protein